MSGMVHPWLGPVAACIRVGRLKHVLAGLKSGGTPDTGNPNFWGNDATPWVAISDMSGTERVAATAKSVTQSGIADKRLEVLQPGTLLYSMYASLGHVSELAIPATTNQAILGLSFDEHVFPRYAFWQLKALQPYVVESASSNTQDNLNAEKVRNLPFAIPPLAVQERISNFLDDKTARIDALIAEKERLVDKLVEYWHSKAAELGVRGLRSEVQMVETGVPYLGSMPSHWQFVPLKSVFRLVAEPAPDDHGLELLSLYTSIGVRPRNELEARGNKATSTDGYWLVRENDLVVNKLLAWMGAVAGSAYSGVTSPAYDILRPSHMANTWYFDALFRSGIYLTEFKSRSRGIMEMRLRLYWEQLGAVKVPLPPKQEQDEIVDALSAQKKRVDSLMEHCLQHIASLREYRSSLISAAVTGQLDLGADNVRVHEPLVCALSI